MEYIDQSIYELRLNLIKGSFNKKALNVLMTKEIEINGYDIEMAIIGASHYYSISKNGEVIFSEVFACVEMKEDFSALYKGDELKKIIKDDFQYEFRSIIRPISQENDCVIDLFKKRSILLFDFKGKDGKSNDAITGLYFEQEENIMRFRTIHVYPNEGQYIETLSIFDFN